LKYESAVALISNGSMVLLKYKLNNVCGADNISANDAQITEQFLYTTIYCDCQYVKYLNVETKKNAVKTQYALSPY